MAGEVRLTSLRITASAPICWALVLICASTCARSAPGSPGASMTPISVNGRVGGAYSRSTFCVGG